MKIIIVDNFDRELVSHPDRLVAENVNERYAKEIAKFLNKKYSSDYSPDFFRVVKDNYKLRKFIP